MYAIINTSTRKKKRGMNIPWYINKFNDGNGLK